MNEDNFILSIIATLNKQLSKRQIQSDIKAIDNSLYVKVIAKLATSLSKRQLASELKKLDNLNIQVGAKLKTDKELKRNLLNENKQLQKEIGELQLKIGVEKNAPADTIKSVLGTAKKAQEYADKTKINLNIETKKEKAINDILYIGQRYSKLFSNISASKKYENLLSSAYSISDKEQLQEVRAQISAFTSELRVHGLAIESAGDKWKKLISRSKEFLSAATIVRIAFTQVKQAISETIDLDKVYTDLVKVNDEVTRNDYSAYLSKINKAAKELATTQKGLIEGATEFSKSGYDLVTSNKLSKQSTILSNVGDMRSADAAKAIISGVQAYDTIDGFSDVESKAEALIDKYNAIGNSASITTAEIAQGVQEVGAVFADANTSVDEFIALISAGNRQFQDANTLALGLRTSALRIRGCKAELEEMGEEADTVVTSISKLEEQIKGLTNIDGSGGVEILEADGKTFRSIYDIYVDIGKVYKEMEDIDQSALLELIAGKNRASAVSATLNNMSEAEEILQNSLNAAGSAQEEFDKYLESTEAHIARFKATLVETYSTFMNGNMISHTADMGTAILELVNATDLLKHSILAVLALNVGNGITAIGAGIASTAKQINVLGSALQRVKSLPLDDILRENELKEIGNLTQNLTEKNLKLLLSQKQLEKNDRIIILGKHNLTVEEAKLKLEKMGLLSVTQSQSAANVAEAATTNTLKGAMVSLKASVSGLWASAKAMFANNPIGIGLMLATTAISVFTTYISKQNEKLEETRQKNIEASDAASEHAKHLKELYNEYMRLVSIQERTNSEEKSFKTAVENITMALGNKSKALEELTAGTEEYTEALAKATKEELQSQAVTATIGRKSAEEELKKKIWSNWGGSQLTVDSNSKGKALSEEAQRATAIVSDSLKEYETINRTWKNISWDISSDDPEKALGFYNALIQAREDLVLAAEEDESLLNTEIYSDLNNSINSMSESLETYIEKRYEEEKLQYMAQKGIPQTIEEYKNMESSMLDVAGASEDLQEKFKELLMEDFTSLATDVENLTDTTDELNNSLSNNILSLAEAKNKINGYKGDDFEILGLIDEFELLQEVLSDTGNVSIETYEKLTACSSKYTSALKVEAGRIVVDNQKLKAINKTRTNAIKTEIKEASTLKKLQWIQEAKKLQQYKFQQNDLTDEIWNTCDSLQEEINQFDILTQGIDAASNAFVNFTEAQDAAESGDYFDIGLDMADAFQKGLESGKIGTPEFLASMEGFMPEDLFAKIINMDDAKAQFKEFQKYYDDVISEFFIRGDDQEYDISGLMNFAKKIASFKDEAGNALYGTFDGTNLNLNDIVDYEALAKDLKINLDMLYALFGELEEYSFDDSFTFDSENIIDNYYDKLSKVTDAQKLYNEALESGNVNQQAIAQKELNDALSNYNEMISGFSDKIIHMEDEWAKSDSKMSFGDYLKETYSSDEFELMYSTAIERAEELRGKIQELNERGIGEGNKQWEEYNSELRKLENGISAIENTTAREELLNEAVKSTRERYEELQEIMEQLEDPELDGETIEQLKQKAIELVSILGQIPESLRIELQSNVDELEAKISSLQDKRAEVVANNKPQLAAGSAGALKQLDSIDSQIAQVKSEKVELEGILSMNTEEAIAKINEVKAQDVDKDSQVHYTADFSACTGSTPPTLDGVVHYKSVFDNAGAPDKSSPIISPKYTGTFNSFATGTPSNVSIKKNEKALVNELGEEGLVRDGKLIPIKGGAQFLKLKRGDIIFNHKQMADLKKHGYTNGRGNIIGNAFANGTVNAYASPYVGTGGVGFFGTKTTKNSTRPNSQKSEKKTDKEVKEKAEKEKEVTEESFDYIERKIKRLQAAFDKWLKQAETALTSGFITKYYKKAANAMSQLLSTQGKAYNRYMQEANAVGLDETYAKKVRAGEIDIQTIQDEDLADKIAKYQEYYDKAIDSTTSFMETAEKLYNLPLDKAAAKIEKFSDAIDLLDKKLDNAIGSKSKNKLVDKQTKEEEKTLEAYKTASKEAAKNYKTAKKTLGKSSTLKNSGVNAKEKKAIQKALKEGREISLSYFKVGSSGYNAAVKYNEALKANTKATYDLATAQEEYNSWLVEASKIKFDNVADDYEKKVQMLDHQVKAIDNRISEIETAGKKVNRSYYDTQKAINARKLAEYRQEKADLEESLKNIKQGTDEWYEAYDQIQQVSSAISDCVKETYNLNNAINQLHFDLFDDTSEKINRIITEQDFLQSLFAHEKTTDSKTGNFTEAGIAKMGSLSASYYAAKNNADRDAAEVKELQRMLDSGTLHSDILGLTFNSIDDLMAYLDEMYTKWQDDTKQTYNVESEIYNLRKEQYQAELDLIKELIDRKKEALSAEKDLHDYQKSITEKTDNISVLQKRIAAYSADTSQEGLAKLQKLQKELSDRETDLRETEYEKYLSDSESMLDKLYTEYEEQITKKLEDFKGLVQEGLETANNNLSGINDYLSKVATDNGYTEETKGLFNGVTGGIKENADRIILSIEKRLEANSGIKSDGQGNAVVLEDLGFAPSATEKENAGNTETKGKSTTVSDTDKANKAYDEHLRLQAEEKKAKAEAEAKKANATKQSSDSSNFELVGESKTSNLELVGKSKASTASFERKEKTPAPVKSGSITEGIFNNLKKLIIPGFKKGGLVSVDDIEKQVHENGDDGLVSVKNGELIIPKELAPEIQKLTEYVPTTPELQKLAECTPVMNNLAQGFVELPKFPIVQPVNSRVENHIDMNVNLPNVKNAKEFVNELLPEFQRNKNFEILAKNMTINRFAGSGVLGKNRQRL